MVGRYSIAANDYNVFHLYPAGYKSLRFSPHSRIYNTRGWSSSDPFPLFPSLPNFNRLNISTAQFREILHTTAFFPFEYIADSQFLFALTCFRHVYMPWYTIPLIIDQLVKKYLFIIWVNLKPPHSAGDLPWRQFMQQQILTINTPLNSFFSCILLPLHILFAYLLYSHTMPLQNISYITFLLAHRRKFNCNRTLAH